MREAPATAPHLSGPARFILHHLLRWRWHFVLLFTLVVASAACGVGQQYVLKRFVDAMAGPSGAATAVTGVLLLFLGLIAAESALARLTGWLACRATIGVGVDLRLELFDVLSAQSMRYFAENLAGSLGQRITATAGNLGALINTLVWRIIPPVVDVGGAVIIFSTIDGTLTAALLAFVVAVTLGLIVFGSAGAPCTGPIRARPRGSPATSSTPSPTCGRSRPSRPAAGNGGACGPGSRPRRRPSAGAGCISRPRACSTTSFSGSWPPVS